MQVMKHFKRTALLGLCVLSALRAPAPASGAQMAEADEREQRIAKTVALLLDHSHYLAARFDDSVSERFFDDYLKALDPSRLHFLQSDVDQFASLRHSLDELTLGRGETGPAYVISGRFMERLGERVAFAKQELAAGKFDFSGNEKWRVDRKSAPWPRDAADAKDLWREALRHEYLQEKLAGKKDAEIVRVLERRYDRMHRTMRDLRRDEILEIYLNALVHAYDPHSDYMGPRQMEDFSIQMNLKLFGVGATLQSVDGFCKVHELVPGGPAARSGKIAVGDRIVAVAQDQQEPVDIIDMPLHHAVELIRGDKDTRVRLTLIPAGAADDSVRKTVTIVRDEIKLEEQEAKARIVDMPTEDGKLRVGIIDLPTFYAAMDGGRKNGGKSATADVTRLLQKLQAEGIEGLILDLRRNGGGSLDEAIDLAGLFIDRGPMVQTKDTSGRVRIGYDSDHGALYSGPLVVLTSRLSASASEIVAGALQDYGRALIVGDTSTFGKGTVQSMVPLAEVMGKNGGAPDGDPGNLKLTIAKFYRPGGASTQLRGVEPDIVLPSMTDEAKIAESELDNAMPWDAVAPAPYQPMNLIGPCLPALRAKSASRVEATKEFAWLREDAEIQHRKIADPVVSLNLDERMKEKARAEATTEARKQERAKLPPPDETVYPITVATAVQPGLPAPAKPDAAKPAAAQAAPADEDAAAPPETDAVLAEAKHILADYISIVRQPVPQNLVRSREAAGPGG